MGIRSLVAASLFTANALNGTGKPNVNRLQKIWKVIAFVGSPLLRQKAKNIDYSAT